MKDQREASRSFSKGVPAEIDALLLITACLWERWRRKYQRATSETTMRTSIVVNSRIVFIYLSLILSSDACLQTKKC
jgi:hypothetical protein